MATSQNSAELPALDASVELESSQIQEYQRDGHTIVRGLASPAEIAVYRPIIHAAADALNIENRPLEERDTYGKAFLQLQNLFVHDADAAKFVLAERFAKVAADLMGVAGVRIYHDQALFKEPGGGPTPWHQDQHYWPLETDQTITMWMPLVDIPASVGSMTFANGSQAIGYVGDMPISDDSERIIAELIEEKGFQTQSHGAMKAGDATFHAGWTLHGAPGNPTPMMREVMTIIYYPDGTRISEPANDSQREDLHKWLPDCQPGQLAASKINPLAFKK